MIGQVIKIFSDFYYVKTDKGIVESKLKGILKKQKKEVYTGDFVELEQFDEGAMQAFISDVQTRTSLISRPKAANISQAIIVSALKEPELNFEQLNRYIAHCEYHKIKPVLCFNKEDISDNPELKELLVNIYEPLEYKIIFTSALKKTGLEELKPILKNNSSILCGSSGAGKSSLINAILNNSRLKTRPVSEKTKRGVHTTRHCELIFLEENSFIADTPGFSHLTFNFLLPVEIQNLFREFKDKKFKCKYKNCVHIDETGCGADKIKNTMDKSRYESYKKFVKEAEEYEEKISKESLKKESNIKYNKNKIFT
ncbi:MAG: ribosome small subunit-dependent GTPase A, partial [Candidatus Gastranaerophilales bacterium]|nr:ribosome small subunit-dependent GTPase A [Candidatus Gastranaerophilales bacterium]